MRRFLLAAINSPTGDIESVLGGAGDKSEAERVELCRSLEGASIGECVAKLGWWNERFGG